MYSQIMTTVERIASCDKIIRECAQVDDYLNLKETLYQTNLRNRLYAQLRRAKRRGEFWNRVVNDAITYRLCKDVSAK